MDLLERLEFVETVTRGYKFNERAKQQTTVRPRPTLAQHFPLADLTLQAFREDCESELLHLKPTKDEDGTSEPIDYKETDRTTRWRREVARLNAWLQAAPISIPGNVRSIALDREGQPVELYRRNLHRVFNNGSWQDGGRLFGGFWMTMRREDRFRLLRIAGEPVANVDFSSLFPRLAYVRADQPQPEGDIYDIGGDGSCRDGWKKLMNALLFAEGRLGNWPEGTSKLLPGMKLAEAISAIKTKHAPIAFLLERGLGYQLMHLESQLLITIVTALFNQGIPALPLHDSVLTGRSHAERAKAVMESIFMHHTGAARAFVKVQESPI
jgi:hypothetical protein